MQISAHRKRLGMLLCVALVAMAFLSMFVVGTHVFHSCTQQEHCDICLIMDSAQSLLRQLGLLAVHMVLLLAVLLAAEHSQSRPMHRRRPATLVSLRIRLNP